MDHRSRLQCRHGIDISFFVFFYSVLFNLLGESKSHACMDDMCHLPIPGDSTKQ